DSKQAYQWTSEGADGYTIEEAEKETIGTQISLHLKEDTEEATFSDFLETDTLQTIIKKYSDFIRYPIKMNVTKSKPKEDKKEDYEQFYQDKHYGFDSPLAYIHANVDGNVRYNAILYIPENIPFDFYSAEYEKGLELYTNGVLIMEKCAALLPDYFSFVKGMV